MKLRPLLALVVLAVWNASGCQSPPRYVFKPRPLVIDLPEPGGTGIVARAVAVVLGVRGGDEKEGRTDEIALRLSLENQSALPISLDPRGFKLVSADLRTFGPPFIEPQPVPDVLPGAETTVELAFPVPVGEELDTYDLSGLNLRFAVRYGDATIVPSATFERWDPRAYDPYYYDDWGPSPYSSLSFGVGVSVSD